VVRPTEHRHRDINPDEAFLLLAVGLWWNLRMLKGSFVACFLMIAATLMSSAQRPKLQVALTFDDLLATGVAPSDVTRAQIIDSIISTLKAEKMPAVGFLNAQTLEGTPSGPGILRNWVASRMDHVDSLHDSYLIAADEYTDVFPARLRTGCRGATPHM
jgi:hypothetical protein